MKVNGKGWQPIYEMENKKNVPNHQPDIYIYIYMLIYLFCAYVYYIISIFIYLYVS